MNGEGWNQFKFVIILAKVLLSSLSPALACAVLTSAIPLVFSGRLSRACARARAPWAESSALRASRLSALPAAAVVGEGRSLTVVGAAGGAVECSIAAVAGRERPLTVVGDAVEGSIAVVAPEGVEVLVCGRHMGCGQTARSGDNPFTGQYIPEITGQISRPGSVLRPCTDQADTSEKQAEDDQIGG